MLAKKALVCIANAYSFTKIENVVEVAKELRALLKDQMGSILIAKEGINCSLSGVEHKLRHALERMWSMIGAKKHIAHFSHSPFDPFSKFKVIVKDEIVKMGKKNLSCIEEGYISPSAWEEFISQDDTIVIDTRNAYECAEGKFQNAVEPMTATFQEFPAWAEANIEKLRNKKVAMYCTGGIRCEKASTYLRHHLGLRHVYQLEGGILGYLKERAEVDKSWIGNCFVFDDRVLLNRKLQIVKKEA
jgi:UPF0176 protein